jgi:hypothetical protein
MALHILGVDLDPDPTLEKADSMFEQVKNEILVVGFDAIVAIPRTSEPRTDLAVALLGDAGMHAYWSTGERFTDIIGLTVRHIPIPSHIIVSCVMTRQFNWRCGRSIVHRAPLVRTYPCFSSGMSPGTALGFFWVLGGVYCYFLSATTFLIALAASAERKELYRFSVDLGKLALRIVEQHGTNADRWYAPCCLIVVQTQRVLQSCFGHVLLHGVRL